MRNRPLSEVVRGRLPALVGFGLPFVMVLFLALEAGGYDLVVRSQVGIIVWWVTLLGLLIGALPIARVTRPGWIALAVLAALVVWTGIATLTWTESAERGMIELSRVATLLGILCLLLLTQGRNGLRHTTGAVAAAIAIVAAVALASRFHPGWFPESGIPENFPVSRLSHPLEYWNALAALLAIGVPPLVWAATSARSITARAGAAGALPLVSLALYLTASRGGAIAVSVALLVLVLLHPRRLALLPTGLVAGLGSGALFLLIDDRPELRDRSLGDLATSQGNEMLWLTIGVCFFVALLQAGIALAEERGTLRLPRPSRRTARASGGFAALLGVLAVFVAFGSGFVGDQWDEFKQPAAGDTTVSRLGNLSSGERYKVWSAAIDASSDEPLTGTGPGTFEYWWAREGTGAQFVRDAHSLYLEALAEMGPVGLLLVLALILGPIGFTANRALRPGSDRRRSSLAAVAAAMTAFAIAAGVDWAWEMTVLPVAFLVLAAAALGPDGESRRGRRTSRFSRVGFDWRRRAGLGIASLVALAVISIPMFGEGLVRESQRLYREGDLTGSLEKADQATGLQPYSATASVQRALVLGALGRVQEGVAEAERATEAEATNWRTWRVLGELAREAGRKDQASRSFERVEGLNDHGPSIDGK